MDTATVADMFAGALLIGVLTVIASFFVSDLRRLVGRLGLAIAATVAVGATLGSLYFSEIADFLPCEMCWVQRIFMYPMALILPIAAVRRDRQVIPYAAILAVVGLGVSIYHVQIQLRPDQSTSCDLLNPCSAKWVDALGFASIPVMAGVSFTLILATLAAHWRAKS